MPRHPTYAKLVKALGTVLDDLTDELGFSRCLKHYGEPCTEDEPCSICQKWIDAHAARLVYNHATAKR